MAKRVLVFAGAPESQTLDWTSPGLLDHFSRDISEFTGLASDSTTPSANSSSLDHARWRSIPLQRRHVPTGFSQLADSLPRGANFFTTAAVSSSTSTASEKDAATADGLLSQFYDQSLAFHEDEKSSQLVPSSVGTSQDTDTTTSFLSTEDTSSSASHRPPPPAYHGGDHLSDVEDIPGASYLAGVEPSTVTVSLIVGIISIGAPRTVTTRWGAAMSLVEVLVGDETKSGFAVTFWLGPGATVERSVLGGLRSQDVVLMHNVALHVFMNKVYGSSLRRGLTKVRLLHRKRAGPEDAGGYYTSAHLSSARMGHPQLEKTRRVRDWVLRFVGYGRETTAPALGGRSWERPPLDDTQ